MFYFTRERWPWKESFWRILESALYYRAKFLQYEQLGEFSQRMVGAEAACSELAQPSRKPTAMELVSWEQENLLYVVLIAPKADCLRSFADRLP